MTVKLALYKGPDKATDILTQFIAHWGICLRTLSKHSHAELVIDGKCYSSSDRDDGVRAKVINLGSGRWEVYDLPKADKLKALSWFYEHKGAKYDWLGILAWVLPVVKHSRGKFVCFEAVGCMLGLPDPHKLTGRKLKAYALSQQE